MSILVATLIDQAKALADRRSDASIPDTDWSTYAGWSVKSLYRKIAPIDPDFFFAQVDFTLSNGNTAAASKDMSSLTGTTPANAVFVALHGLDLNPDTPQRQTVPRRNFQERNRGRIGWWFPTILSVDRSYDLRGKTLTITPYEVAAGNYRAYFRQRPYIFTGPTDTNPLDVQFEDYDEYLAVRMAMFALDIEEGVSDPWAARLAGLEEEIIDEHDRDDESPGRIADVEQDSDINQGGWW